VLEVCRNRRISRHATLLLEVNSQKPAYSASNGLRDRATSLYPSGELSVRARGNALIFAAPPDAVI